MPIKLSDFDIEILRKLVNGEAVSISSQHRVRLELAGMTREGPKGIEVTLAGRNVARRRPANTAYAETQPDNRVARDGRGRRLPFQRKSAF